MAVADGTTSILVDIISRNRLMRSGLRLLIESRPGLIVVGEYESLRDACALASSVPAHVALVDMTHESDDALRELRSSRARGRILVLTRQDSPGTPAIEGDVACVRIDGNNVDEVLARAIQTVPQAP